MARIISKKMLATEAAGERTAFPQNEDGWKRGGYSYTGKTLGLNLGYLPMQSTFVNFGYSHAKRDFDTAVSFNTTAQTLYADVTQRLAKNWYLNGGYAYQKNDSNIAGTDYNNHIVSLGVNFSY